MRTVRFVLLLVAVSLTPHLCQAQWRTQTIQLQPGWNAVHLEVQPRPDRCDILLVNPPVESVWKWNRRFTTIQFATDPSTLLPEDPDWLVWLPLSNEKVLLRRLDSGERTGAHHQRPEASHPPSHRHRPVLPPVPIEHSTKPKP